jgi:hypothetical protein
MSLVFENFSGPAMPQAATSSCTKIKGSVWHSLNFDAMLAPLKIAVGWPGHP